jgi:hypothetical protein
MAESSQGNSAPAWSMALTLDLKMQKPHGLKNWVDL